MAFKHTVTAVAAILSAAAWLVVRAEGPEPSVTFDVPGRSDSTPFVAASGSFVAVAWGASAEGKADVFVATSSDGGRTFATPVQVNREPGEARLGGELPPRVALHGDGAGGPTISVLWNARGATTSIRLARSTDGGRTFDAPTILQSDGVSGDRGWPALAVDGSGIAHAIWLDHRGLAARRAAAGGTTGTARHTHNAATGVDSSVMAQGSSLYHAATGAGPVQEREVTKGVCYCCKTALATGPGDLLVAAWRHVYSGDLRDIALSLSHDAGRSFSAPARVSEDGWAINGCPDDGPAIAVGGDGRVHIVWPTVIPGDEPVGALFYASTRDGRQFTRRVRIPTLGSPKPMHPQVSLAADGSLAIAWDELLDGQRVAVVRRLTSTDTATPSFGDAVRLTSTEGGSHPVLANVAGGVFAVWSTGGDASLVRARIVTP